MEIKTFPHFLQKGHLSKNFFADKDNDRFLIETILDTSALKCGNFLKNLNDYCQHMI